jgi:hypothetical protein
MASSNLLLGGGRKEPPWKVVDADRFPPVLIHGSRQPGTLGMSARLKAMRCVFGA